MTTKEDIYRPVTGSIQLRKGDETQGVSFVVFKMGCGNKVRLSNVAWLELGAAATFMEEIAGCIEYAAMLFRDGKSWEIVVEDSMIGLSQRTQLKDLIVDDAALFETELTDTARIVALIGIMETGGEAPPEARELCFETLRRRDFDPGA